MILTGIIYPFTILGIAQVSFPHQANGSLIKRSSQIVGSELIGQRFIGQQYFHSRPSAAGEGYDGQASGGSNLGPTNKNLVEAIETRASQAMLENPGLRPGDIPVDMVTMSGSGLDPDITLANAYAQISRVAEARDVPKELIREIIDTQKIDRQFKVLGEPRVNVLRLNRTLDEKSWARNR